MDTFRVYCRCRPLNELQISYGAGRKAVSMLDSTSICINDGTSKEHTFQLDGVFQQTTCNKAIFDEAIIPLIDNVLFGINSTVFAYGITGAGKSFTMFGNAKPVDTEKTRERKEVAGLIPLTFLYLMNQCANEPDAKIKVSYLEIYNQQVFDLLQSHQQNLQLSEDPIQGCVIVQDLTQLEIRSAQQAEGLISVGNSRRVIAETKANEVSSRSHAIVIINIERRIRNTDQFYSAKLSLVDLAGSEKQSVHSETRGIRTFEGSNINRSLLTLGNCINILSEKRKLNSVSATQFIPYRDSKLTRLLKDSLGGNTKTVMIACVSPSLLYYEETLNTLKYACRANKIEKVVHQNIRQAKTLEEYKKQINTLKKQNEMLKMSLSTTSMPAFSAVFAENRKTKVTEALEKLTKIIEERVVLMAMSGSEERMQSIEKIVRLEEQIKLSIIDEFDIKGFKKGEVVKPENYNENQARKKNNNWKGGNEGQINEVPKLPKQVGQNRGSLVPGNQANSKPVYYAYKLSLKQELKNEVIADSRSRNYQLVNLQNLRKKVMEDKKQISNFKQQMMEGHLSTEEVQAKANKLLRLGQESSLRLSEDEIEYLKKIANGGIEGELSENFLSTKKKMTSLVHHSISNEPNPFILNLIQQNGVEHSRNRHLVSLNRIISLAKGNNPGASQPQPAANYDRQPAGHSAEYDAECGPDEGIFEDSLYERQQESDRIDADEGPYQMHGYSYEADEQQQYF